MFPTFSFEAIQLAQPFFSLFQNYIVCYSLIQNCQFCHCFIQNRQVCHFFIRIFWRLPPSRKSIAFATFSFETVIFVTFLFEIVKISTFTEICLVFHFFIRSCQASYDFTFLKVMSLFLFHSEKMSDFPLLFETF